MKIPRYIAPIDSTRIRRIQGSFSWIDHRFICWMESLSCDENLLYLWLVTVGDRHGLSFYSDEKTASRLKITVSEIAEARLGLIRQRLIAYRNGISQVLQLPNDSNCSLKKRSAHVIPSTRSGHGERKTYNADSISSGCRETVVSADGGENRNLSKRIVQDILRRLEGTSDTAGISARRAT